MTLTLTSLLESAAERIVSVIKERANGTPAATTPDLCDLCFAGFGLPTRALDAPLDFFGEVRGDIGGDDACIYYNSAQPPHVEMRTLLHELAEYLAARDEPSPWDGIDPQIRSEILSAVPPQEFRHRVASRVEEVLAAEMGLNDPRSSWPVSEILRLIPLDPKYVEPRTEIEHIDDDPLI